MSDELKAMIILDFIDNETGFNWNNNDDIFIEAIKGAFMQIRLEELKCKNEEIKRRLEK